MLHAAGSLQREPPERQVEIMESLRARAAEAQARAAEDAKAAGLKALLVAKLAACKEARPSDDGKTVFLDRRKK